MAIDSDDILLLVSILAMFVAFVWFQKAHRNVQGK